VNGGLHLFDLASATKSKDPAVPRRPKGVNVRSSSLLSHLLIHILVAINFSVKGMESGSDETKTAALFKERIDSLREWAKVLLTFAALSLPRFSFSFFQISRKFENQLATMSIDSKSLNTRHLVSFAPSLLFGSSSRPWCSTLPISSTSQSNSRNGESYGFVQRKQPRTSETARSCGAA